MTSGDDDTTTRQRRSIMTFPRPQCTVAALTVDSQRSAPQVVAPSATHSKEISLAWLDGYDCSFTAFADLQRRMVETIMSHRSRGYPTPTCKPAQTRTARSHRPHGRSSRDEACRCHGAVCAARWRCCLG